MTSAWARPPETRVTVSWMTLTAGQPAPSFTLPSSDGGTLALDDLRGSIVVLYFYPRDNTPGCTVEANDFNTALPELKKLGAVVLGVSKDSIASHCKFRDKYELNFPLLSDPDGGVLEAYGAWGDKVLYGKKSKGAAASSSASSESKSDSSSSSKDSGSSSGSDSSASSSKDDS